MRRALPLLLQSSGRGAGAMAAACAARLLPAPASAPSTSSSECLRSASKGLGEAPSLRTRRTCAKVRCTHSDGGDEPCESNSGLKAELRSRRDVLSNGLDDSKLSTCRTSGRRDFLNLAIGLGSALLVGRWTEKGTAVAVTKKDTRSAYDEKKLLDQNRRMQKVNNAPEGFPNFIREGFEVRVVTDEKYVTARSGLIYYDLVEGQGELPKDGQQVKFHYTGYNENGRRIDSSYQQGEPARTRLGIKGMIPGFEEGIRTMKPGGKRRIVIPPELGPPVGPSTFFSAKQFEVFDVELLEVKDCVRRTVFLYSDVVCVIVVCKEEQSGEAIDCAEALRFTMPPSEPSQHDTESMKEDRHDCVELISLNFGNLLSETVPFSESISSHSSMSSEVH